MDNNDQPIVISIGDLVTSVEAALLLGLKNPNTLAVWRCNKSQPLLKFIRIGRNIRYSRAAIQEFLDAMTIGGADGGIDQ